MRTHLCPCFHVYLFLWRSTISLSSFYSLPFLALSSHVIIVNHGMNCNYKYAGHALKSLYSTWPTQGEIIVTGNTYDNYGPAFVIFTSLTANLLHSFNPNWLISDYRHFIYFLVFLAGVWAFHDIAKRWINQFAALIAILLFLTQPLFWGHAFFSPKDIPFIDLFLLSLSFGFRMVDSTQLISFNSSTPSARRNLLGLFALWLVSVFSLYLFTDAFRLLIEILSVLQHLAKRISSPWSHLIFTRLKPEVYIRFFLLCFLWARSIFFLLSSSILLFFTRGHLPSAFRILPAAIILGITASTRILGPLAGLIVVYYAFRNTEKKSLPILAIYAVIAIITMYITWPYLLAEIRQCVCLKVFRWCRSIHGRDKSSLTGNIILQQICLYPIFPFCLQFNSLSLFGLCL